MPKQNKLVIVASGTKQSGKSSLCKMILTELINHKIKQKRFILEQVGPEVFVVDTFRANAKLRVDMPSVENQRLFDTYSVKFYSFADPLKEFCINVLGLSPLQCYGSDSDKNSETHISWDDVGLSTKREFAKARKQKAKQLHGKMTGREVMEVFGTYICRRWDKNCWAHGLYNIIAKDGYELALVTDARFPNEVTLGTEQGAKVVRLTRRVNKKKNQPEPETALNNFPLGEYTLVIDNEKLTLEECHKVARPHILSWLENYGLI